MIFVVFSSLPNSAWADEGLADLAVHFGNMEVHPN